MFQQGLLNSCLVSWILCLWTGPWASVSPVPPSVVFFFFAVFSPYLSSSQFSFHRCRSLDVIPENQTHKLSWCSTNDDGSRCAWCVRARVGLGKMRQRVSSMSASSMSDGSSCCLSSLLRLQRQHSRPWLVYCGALQYVKLRMWRALWEQLW